MHRTLTRHTTWDTIILFDPLASQGIDSQSKTPLISMIRTLFERNHVGVTELEQQWSIPPRYKVIRCECVKRFSLRDLAKYLNEMKSEMSQHFRRAHVLSILITPVQIGSQNPELIPYLYFNLFWKIVLIGSYFKEVINNNLDPIEG